MSRRLSLLAILLSLTAGPLAGAGVLPTGSAVGDQDISPFYRWTGELPQAPGTPLRTEPLPAALSPDEAGAALRILYVSEDHRWQSGAVPVSGALFLPKGEPGKDGWPLLVWAHGTLGMADACAPSWTGPVPRDRAYIGRWLAQGYAVVATDYQGLGGPGPEPYLDWRAEGRSVLDSARAALRADPRIKGPIAISGQSQGSGAALGAATLAATYAPDLKVTAVIAAASVFYMPKPGTPPETTSPGAPAPHFLMYRMLAAGMPMDDLLTPKGQTLMTAIREGCAPRPVAEREGVTLENAFVLTPEAISLMLGSAGQAEPVKMSFPVMIGGGLADELIPVARQKTAVAGLCKAGNTVVWKAYEGAGHGETLARSFDDAEAFVRAAVDGKVRSGCP